MKPIDSVSADVGAVLCFGTVGWDEEHKFFAGESMEGSWTEQLSGTEVSPHYWCELPAVPGEGASAQPAADGVLGAFNPRETAPLTGDAVLCFGFAGDDEDFQCYYVAAFSEDEDEWLEATHGNVVNPVWWVRLPSEPA